MRVFDDNYQVLTKDPIVIDIDLDADAMVLSAALALLLAKLAERGRRLENEPMDSVRLEIWDTLGRNKLMDYDGGIVLR